MKAYIVKKNVLVHDSPPHPVQISKFLSVSTKEFITVFANLGYRYYCGNQKSEYYMLYILSF